MKKKICFLMDSIFSFGGVQRVTAVAFTCPCGPKDIVTDGEDGILCENDNLLQLSQGICRLIENEDLRKLMGQKAAKNIERYSVDNIMRQWIQLFNSNKNDR